MMPSLERPTLSGPSLHQVLADFGPIYAGSGFIGFMFAASGPLAIILSTGTRGGLSPAELASWIFGVFFINGLITLGMSWCYRQPLAFFWTIPGTVLVGPSLQHLSFPEVIGAFYATSLLILVLGASGWVKRAMQFVPMPIVMGMVAGVFLRFGLDLVRALHSDFAIAVPMCITFLVLSTRPALGRRMPPLIGALLVGAVVVAVLGRIDPSSLGSFRIVRPLVQTPAWSLAAMIELVVPLALTVVVVQNGQGFAVLQNAGHHPPINTTTVMCGIGSFFAAMVGAVSSCLTGPTNALITSSGLREHHYTAAMFTGLLAMAFSLLAPAFIGLMLAAPKEFIMVLGGLAMLRVLQAAFIASFSNRFTLGALISFLVTVTDLAILNIGAAFWGLIAGFAVSWLLEEHDFLGRPSGSG
jgi:benzoate membrane transport protein